MSEAGAPREWRFYVEDMGAFCDKSLAEAVRPVAVREGMVR